MDRVTLDCPFLQEVHFHLENQGSHGHPWGLMDPLRKSPLCHPFLLVDTPEKIKVALVICGLFILGFAYSQSIFYYTVLPRNSHFLILHSLVLTKGWEK